MKCVKKGLKQKNCQVLCFFSLLNYLGLISKLQLKKKKWSTDDFYKKDIA